MVNNYQPIENVTSAKEFNEKIDFFNDVLSSKTKLLKTNGESENRFVRFLKNILLFWNNSDVEFVNVARSVNDFVNKHKHLEGINIVATSQVLDKLLLNQNGAKKLVSTELLPDGTVKKNTVFSIIKTTQETLLENKYQRAIVYETKSTSVENKLIKKTEELNKTYEDEVNFLSNANNSQQNKVEKINDLFSAVGGSDVLKESYVEDLKNIQEISQSLKKQKGDKEISGLVNIKLKQLNLQKQIIAIRQSQCKMEIRYEETMQGGLAAFFAKNSNKKP